MPVDDDTMPVEDGAMHDQPAATVEHTGEGSTVTGKSRLHKWHEQSKLLEKLLSSNGMSLDSVDHPLCCVCECMFDTIHLIILMLVCYQVRSPSPRVL